MVRFRFETARGKIDIGQGKYVFTSVENLNGADTSMQTNVYTCVDGAEYDNILYDVPTTTVKGYIRAENLAELRQLQANMFKIVNGKDKGKLFYSDGRRTYFTEVLPLIPQVSARTQNYISFVLYFKRYRVYWKASRLSTYNVYSIVKNLKTTFTLPCVFSTRLSKCDVINYGDIDAHPVITVKGLGTNVGIATGTGFTVRNNTTGKHIEVAYDPAENETVTIDMHEYTVAGDTEGNVINKVTPASEFFCVAPGINEIEVVNNNTLNEIVAQIKFYCPYLGV